MAIPESQLTTWANQGAITTAKATADSVKNTLKKNFGVNFRHLPLIGFQGRCFENSKKLLRPKPNNRRQ